MCDSLFAASGKRCTGGVLYIIRSGVRRSGASPWRSARWLCPDLRQKYGFSATPRPLPPENWRLRGWNDNIRQQGDNRLRMVFFKDNGDNSLRMGHVHSYSQSCSPESFGGGRRGKAPTFTAEPIVPIVLKESHAEPIVLQLSPIVV